MPSSDTASKRRSISPTTRRAVLRSELFSFYRDDHRYRKFVAIVLLPLWQAFGDDARARFGESLAIHPHFEHALAAAEGRPNSLLDAFSAIPRFDLNGQPIPSPGPLTREQLDLLRKYVEAVQHQVTSSLGLTWNGQPPSWALQYVHTDVTRVNEANYYDPAVRPDDNKLDLAQFQLSVGPGWVSIQKWNERPLVKPDGVVGPVQPSGIRWTDGNRQGPGLDGEDWKRLEAKAQEFLSQGIAELRAWYQANSERHNQPKLQHETVSLEQLYLYLYPKYPNRRPKDPPKIQQALRRIADLIEVDYPVAGSR